MRFKKKPVTVSAFQWTPGVCFPSPDFDGLHAKARVVGSNETPDEHYLEIDTLEGKHRANPGDWIIRGVEGEFYSCKPSIFAATYEEAKE